MGIKSYLNKNKQIQTFVIFRGIIGFVSAICLFYGLTKLPLSISLLLFNTIPLWTFTAATLILRI